MADQLADPADLASLLERDDIDLYKATLLVECGTAVVQEAAGNQRIVYVTGDVADLLGTTDSWLDLPQRPVAKGAVTAVTVDGQAVTDFKQFGGRLFRRCGWQTSCGEPSEVAVTYNHGVQAPGQRLQLARNAVLSTIVGVYGNPGGASSEQIDDYSVTYDRLARQMDASPALKQALQRQYGRRAGLVRIG